MQPPLNVTAGSTFQLAWTTTGSPTHVNVHWDPTDPTNVSNPVAGSTSDSTVSPTSSPVVLTAPTKNTDGSAITSPITVKYAVHFQTARGPVTRPSSLSRSILLPWDNSI